ncbi:hypothetical protein, partial [Arenimonas composti]
RRGLTQVLGVMNDLLSRIRARFARNTSTPTGAELGRGFVYVPHDEEGSMAIAEPQLIVGRFTDEPPWIVVDHDTTSGIVAKWPGRLWEVEILRKALQQPLPYAKYTRATAVRVLRELPLERLFEHGGSEIAQLLNRTGTLSEAQATKLSNGLSKEAAIAHDAVWDRWLQVAEPASPYIGQSHVGTLAIGSRSPRSPAGNAPSILCSVLSKRARSLCGVAAFVADGEDETFATPWSGAFQALLHAVLGYGATPALLREQEREQLTRAYQVAVSDDA